MRKYTVFVILILLLTCVFTSCKTSIDTNNSEPLTNILTTDIQETTVNIETDANTDEPVDWDNHVFTKNLYSIRIMDTVYDCELTYIRTDGGVDDPDRKPQCKFGLRINGVDIFEPCYEEYKLIDLQKQSYKDYAILFHSKNEPYRFYSYDGTLFAEYDYFKEYFKIGENNVYYVSKKDDNGYYKHGLLSCTLKELVKCEYDDIEFWYGELMLSKYLPPDGKSTKSRDRLSYFVHQFNDPHYLVLSGPYKNILSESYSYFYYTDDDGNTRYLDRQFVEIDVKDRPKIVFE